MTDPLTRYKALDPGRVDILDQVELQYWCRELHCNEVELLEAVSKVGEHIAVVREHLASRR